MPGARRNLRRALADVLLSTSAAALAWLIAGAFSGSPAPIFAPIAAIVCLGPGIPNRRRQAVGMFIGVVVGIGFGELARLLPFGATVQIALATPLAMLAAAAVDYRPVMIIQAAASVILVIASTQVASGFERFADAAVGGAVGLLFTQVLFTPDPVRMIERYGSDWEVARGGRDSQAARAAAAALDDAIARARGIARWSVRGRMRADDVATTADRWRRRLDALGGGPTASR